VALGIGMNIDIAALPIARAQKPDGGQIHQLLCGPQPFPGERLLGGLVNQTNEVQLVRHGRELAADGLRSEDESAIKHTIPQSVRPSLQQPTARRWSRIQSVSVVAGRPGAGIKWRAPSNAFSKACGSYRSDVSLLLVNLDRDTASRSSGPGQALERARRSTLCPSFAISSGRLFLNGLLASMARFCFTDTASIKLLPNREKGFIIER